LIDRRAELIRGRAGHASEAVSSVNPMTSATMEGRVEVMDEDSEASGGQNERARNVPMFAANAQGRRRRTRANRPDGGGRAACYAGRRRARTACRVRTPPTFARGTGMLG